MALIYETITESGPSGARKVLQVSGCRGRVRDLAVPEQEDGMMVRSIGGHAFAHHQELRSVLLPGSLTTLRSFAFYGCLSLRSMELYNTTEDYYDGVIRQCPLLRYITVHELLPDNYVIVREMLRDVEKTLAFRLLTRAGELWLTFPEYVSEAQEDTMARAIHLSIEGAGMAYRECVGKKSIDLAGYDRLLGRLTEDDFSDAVRIALGRLGHPVELSGKACAGYEEFLRENDVRVLESLIAGGSGCAAQETERREGFRVLFSRELIGRAALEAGLELLSARGEAGLCAQLMEYRRRVFPGKGAGGFSLQF